VINYDYPTCSEDYVHRIGRTGRRDRKGTSYTFFTLNNAKSAQDLIKVLEEAGQEVNPKLYHLVEMGKGMKSRGRGRWRSDDDDGGYRGGFRGGKRPASDNYGGGNAKRGRFDGGSRSFGQGNAANGFNRSAAQPQWPSHGAAAGASYAPPGKPPNLMSVAAPVSGSGW